MKVIIADDHALFRGGLRLQLQQFKDGIEVIDVDDFAKLFAAVTEQRPDMAIVDLGMPGMPWREAIGKLRTLFPETRLVVLSANDDDNNVREAIRLGANGFISKSDSPEVVMAALQLVSCGGTCVPLNFIRHTGPTSVPTASGISVTQRQREVLELMAEGCPNKLIAHKLQLTEGTVKQHVAAVLKALGATNRTQAIVVARSAGVLSDLGREVPLMSSHQREMV